MYYPPKQRQLDQVPALYETENIPLEDKLVYFHFSIDRSHWWAMEWDGEDIFFGYVMLNGFLQDAELGYFSLSELQQVKVGGFLEVMNEPTWRVRPVKDVHFLREILNFKKSLYRKVACKTG